MSEVLSTDQIAQLVAEARGTSAPETAPTGQVRAATRPRRVREVDFSRPTKFTQDQQRRIERVHEGFCRAASLRLTNELRTDVELEIINLTQLTLSGAIAGIAPSSLYGITLTHPLQTHILFWIEQRAATSMVERLLGGEPGESGIERELTDIELALARRAMASVVGELSTAWEELFSLTLGLVSLETQLVNVQIAPPSEPTVALTIELRSDETAATAGVIVPFRAIEAVVEQLVTSPVEAAVAQDDESTAAVRATIEAVDVELRVEVGSVELSLAELLALQPGDVIELEASAAQGVTVYADQVPIQRAGPGRRGTARAIEILDRIGDRS